MTRFPLYLAAITAAAMFAGAATAVFAAPQDAGSGAGGQQRPRAKIDANGDGVISREEAAKFPRLAERFDELDKNHDGKLDASERPQRRGGREHGGRHGGAGGAARLDTDGDGRISQAEAAKSPRLAQNFAQIDANKDGYIVRSELRAYMQRERPKWEAERAKRFDAKFAEADLNHDGKLSKIEVQEKMPRLASQFAFLDENRDGFLSKTELKPDAHR
ncbi:EF-hand domain-containing protein [Lysobacter enzymogenes]|uniref:Calcium-binding EF-hand-containing protein n=1 Tax=Lysobacter enzymogenes TaxID=69 RepID=A0AAU9AK00_LYSEN|nr:EF-hand domain-containing protein [Lysobacter enzymogenes]BAV98849.1 calcium-binding EF-hand-containing protein [Lysobacter enzymogenes]